MTPTSEQLRKEIELRNQKLKTAWVIFIFLALITLAGSVALSYNAQQSNVKVLESQSRVLANLQAQSKKRDANLVKILDDSRQQTLILCTLILNDGGSLSDQEAAQVEEICKQRIEQSGLQAIVPLATPVPTTSPSNTNTAKPSGGSGTPATAQSQQPENKPEEKPAKLLDCKVDLLGLHMGCP